MTALRRHFSHVESTDDTVQRIQQGNLNIKLRFFHSFNLDCERLATSAWVVSKCNRFISPALPLMFSFLEDGQSAFCIFDVGHCLVFMSTARCPTPGVKCNMIHHSPTCMVSSQNYKYNFMISAISNETFFTPHRGKVVKLTDEAVSH